MDFSFTEDQQTLRKSVREVLADKAGPAVFRKAMGSKTGTDDALWKTATELGWQGVALPESAGGLGLGLVEACILQEEIGRAIAAFPFFSTVCLAAHVVGQVDESHALLAAIASGEVRATVALGQKDGRWDAGGVAVKAAKTDTGSWRFTGTARNVSDAHLADRLVVVARTQRSRKAEEGISVFVIPASALKSKPKAQASLDGTRRLADVRLGGVEVPADALVGSEGTAWPAVERGLDRAAVLLAAEGVGVASEVLDRTVAYAKEREQFGKAIGSFQAVSHRLAEMLLHTEGARSNAYYAAWALDEGTPDAPMAAATAKAAAADAVRLAAGDAIQLHGGIGFTWEHEMHLFYRRGKWCELFLGDAGAWRERIAAHLAAS